MVEDWGQFFFCILLTLGNEKSDFEEDEMTVMQLAAAKIACSLQNKEAYTMCSS
jgi:hypothetical protein